MYLLNGNAQRIMKLLSMFIRHILMLSCLASCVEITPIRPRELASTCSPPTLQKNIVGTWSYVSTYNLWTRPDSLVTTRGKIAFAESGQIIDPDSLFENHINGKVVLSKTFYISSTIRDNNQSTVMMNVELDAGGFRPQTNFLKLVSNECNTIRFLDNQNKVIGFTLTRIK